MVIIRPTLCEVYRMSELNLEKIYKKATTSRMMDVELFCEVGLTVFSDNSACQENIKQMKLSILGDPREIPRNLTDPVRELQKTLEKVEDVLYILTYRRQSTKPKSMKFQEKMLHELLDLTIGWCNGYRSSLLAQLDRQTITA